MLEKTWLNQAISAIAITKLLQACMKEKVEEEEEEEEEDEEEDEEEEVEDEEEEEEEVEELHFYLNNFDDADLDNYTKC